MKKLALLLALALLCPAALAEGPLWLHGDFAGAQVEEDGIWRDSAGALSYSKVLYIGDLTLSAYGHPKEDGEFLKPEDTLEDASALESLGKIAVDGHAAEHWRFVDAADQSVSDVRWDMVQIDAGNWIYSVMIAAPLETAPALDAKIASLIASLSLKGEPQDELAMLTADFSGFRLFMDELSAGEAGDPSRATAHFYGDEDSISVTIMRADPRDNANFSSVESMREAFTAGGAQDLVEVEIGPISGHEATRLRYSFEMDNGTRARADAVLISTDACGYAALIGLMVEPTEHYEAIIEDLISSLTLDR